MTVIFGVSLIRRRKSRHGVSFVYTSILLNMEVSVEPVPEGIGVGPENCNMLPK